MVSEPKESCILRVRVQPKASRNQVVGYDEGTLRLRVTAPPTDGKANTAVVKLLSNALGVSKSRIAIVRGHRARQKVIEVEGLSDEDLRARLAAAPAHD